MVWLSVSLKQPDHIEVYESAPGFELRGRGLLDQIYVSSCSLILADQVPAHAMVPRPLRNTDQYLAGIGLASYVSI